MKARGKAWALMLLLAGCAWEPEPQGYRRASGPDYRVENPVLTVMDVSGHPYYRLQARSMMHFVDKALTEIEAPSLIFYTSPPWFVRSERGQILEEGRRVVLLGEVRVRREGEMPVRVVTRNLTVYPSSERVETREPVEADFGPHRVTGTGFRGDFKERRFMIMSQVKARYVPLP